MPVPGAFEFILVGMISNGVKYELINIGLGVLRMYIESRKTRHKYRPMVDKDNPEKPKKEREAFIRDAIAKSKTVA